MTNQLVLRALTLSIAATFAGSGPAVATLVPIEQDRSISGFARVDFATDSGSHAAPDFAPFAESVEALVNLGYAARGFASQDSTITPSLLVANGTAEAGGNASFDSWIQAWSYSEFSLTFELETERIWEIDAAVGVSWGAGMGNFSAGLSLEGPGGATILVLSDEEQFSGQVVLAPGLYVLSARASADASPTDLDSDFGTASFSVRLQEIPEPNALALLALGIGLLGLARTAGRAGG